MNDDVTNRNAAFRRLYRAHDIITDIGERIQSLYASATISSPKMDGMPKSQPNPQRFENIMVKILDLQKSAEELLNKRIDFDIFVCLLSPLDKRLLDLRCEDCLTWKEVAAELDISTDTAKRTFGRICRRAEKAGIFDPLE